LHFLDEHNLPQFSNYLTSTCIYLPLFCEVRVAHLFSFLCCVFVCLSSFCAQCYPCLGIVHSWLPLLFFNDKCDILKMRYLAKSFLVTSLRAMTTLKIWFTWRDLFTRQDSSLINIYLFIFLWHSIHPSIAPSAVPYFAYTIYCMQHVLLINTLYISEIVLTPT